MAVMAICEGGSWYLVCKLLTACYFSKPVSVPQLNTLSSPVGVRMGVHSKNSQCVRVTLAKKWSSSGLRPRVRAKASSIG